MRLHMQAILKISRISRIIRIIFVKGDICDQDLIPKLFKEYDFDAVVNFAAESHVDRSIENPGIFVSTNVEGTQNLLDNAKKAVDNRQG